MVSLRPILLDLGVNSQFPVYKFPNEIAPDWMPVKTEDLIGSYHSNKIT